MRGLAADSAESRCAAESRTLDRHSLRSRGFGDRRQKRRSVWEGFRNLRLQSPRNLLPRVSRAAAAQITSVS
jgi:hypothetical protein